MSRALLVAAFAAVSLTAVACTSSGGSAPSSPVSSPGDTLTGSVVLPSTSAATVSSSAAPTSAPSSSASPSPSASASSSASTTATPTPTPTHTGPPVCAQLKAVGVRGGAGQGLETAGVVFTNTSSQTCTLRGYPFAQLRYKGKALGRAATHNPGTVRTVVLKPGAAAQALLTAVTTCQAAVSDHARVIAPGSTSSTDIAIQLRGCALSVDPLEAA